MTARAAESAKPAAGAWERGRLWGRVRIFIGSTPFLGIAVALASWNVGAFTPPAPGPDFSWEAGLYMATHQGLDFGSQVVWTYGPLGFLEIPIVFYGDLASFAFIYSALLYVAFCLSLIWAVRRGLGAPIAVIATFVTAVVFRAVDYPLVLAAVWCFVALSEDAPPFTRWLVVFGGGVLAAVELLAKLNPGLPIAALLVITVCVMDGWRRKWSIPAFAATFSVSLSALWLASGQGLGNIVDYARGAAQIASGYSEVMGMEWPGLGWQVPLGAIAIAILVFVGLAPTRDLRWSRRASLALMLAVVLFPLYKEGFVRHDPNHAAIFFATSLALGVAVFPTLERGWLAAPAIVALGGLAIATLPSGTSPNINPIDHLGDLEREVRTLLSSERRNAVTAVGRSAMKDGYRVDRPTLSLLRGRRVHVDPWEAGIAWAYRLDWRPLPVFQEYSAYTAELDEMNAEALASPGGPERILRHNTRGSTIDVGYPPRYRAWDPPATAVSMLCNFKALRTTPGWEVLQRVADRCGRRRLIRSPATRFGATFQVPKPPRRNDVVIAVIHGAGVQGIERLETLAYRAQERYVVVNGERRYRFVPGTAADGLLVRAPCSVDFPRPFALGPNARTILLEKGSSQDPLRVDFYAMHVRPASAGC